MSVVVSPRIQCGGCDNGIIDIRLSISFGKKREREKNKGARESSLPGDAGGLMARRLVVRYNLSSPWPLARG